MHPGIQVLIVVLLVVIAVGVIALLRRPRNLIAVDPAPLKELMANFTHHVEVDAVLALVNRIASQPELKIGLAEYGQQVVDAALAYRMNALASSLKEINDNITQQRGYLASTSTSYATTHRQYTNNVAALEAQATAVQSQLNTLNGIIQERVSVS